MKLRDLQSGFIACLHDQDAPAPVEWGDTAARGLEVYRNNYRGALLESLRTTYERTRRWVGDAPFDAAATHHLVAHPPSGWSLDDAGAGFARTLATLFTRDPEVPELAALEWALHRASIAADAPALDLARFRAATAGFDDEDWAALRLSPLPGLATIPVQTDCVALWRALGDDRRPPDPPRLDRPHAAIAWREGLRPVCCLAEAWQADALRDAAAGLPFGALCERLSARHGAAQAPVEAGRLLAWWIEAGMLAGAQ